MDSKAFSRILGDCLYGVAPSHTARAVAEYTLQPEITLQSYIQKIVTNDAYCAFIQKLDVLAKRRAEWAAEIEERPDKDAIIVERLIRLLGRDSTRNVILSIHINRLAKEKLPHSDKDKLVLNPPDQLKFALLAENDRASSNKPGADIAFIAGWHYDIVLAAFRGRGIGSKALEKQAEAVFRESLREGKFAEALAEKMNNLELGKYSIASCLLLGLGRLLMEHFFPGDAKGAGWPTFQKELETWTRARATVQILREPRKFIIQHEELASLVISFVGLLRPIERAVRYSGMPSYLKKVDPPSHRMSQVLLLTRQMMAQKSYSSNAWQRLLMTELGVPDASVSIMHRKAMGGG